MEVTSNYAGDDPILSELKERVSHPELNTSFTCGWYEPGIRDMVPPQYYEQTVQKLNRFLPQMTPEQELAFENFSLTSFVETGKESYSVARWMDILSGLAN